MSRKTLAEHMEYFEREIRKEERKRIKQIIHRWNKETGEHKCAELCEECKKDLLNIIDGDKKYE